MTDGERIDALEDKVRDLENTALALKLALYAAFNSRGRSLEAALQEAEAGLLSHGWEVEATMMLKARARTDLQLMGVSGEADSIAP